MTTEMVGQTPQTTAIPDAVAEVQNVLAASDEPLTLAKIRSRLPVSLRQLEQKELEEVLQRQVAANVFHQFPKYRGQNERYWDRPMSVHIAHLLHHLLAEKAMPWAELRRKLPAYAQGQAEKVFQEELAQGRLFRYPRTSGRGNERFGAHPPNPKDYLRTELTGVFQRLANLGFNRSEVRQAGLELLHEEEWDLTPPAEEIPETTPTTQGKDQSEPTPEMSPAQPALPLTPPVETPAPASALGSDQPDSPDSSPLSGPTTCTTPSSGERPCIT
jgi:hypothetical protein